MVDNEIKDEYNSNRNTGSKSKLNKKLTQFKKLQKSKA